MQSRLVTYKSPEAAQMKHEAKPTCVLSSYEANAKVPRCQPRETCPQVLFGSRISLLARDRKEQNREEELP